MIATTAVPADTATTAVSEATAIGIYLVYFVTAVTLVVFLAKTLHRNGQVFLDEAFEQPELAQSVNQLLVIGFYLLNLGYALMVYQLQPSYQSLTFAFNELIVNLGILLLSLGVIHLLNMFVFWKIRGAKDHTPRRNKSGPGLPPPAGFVPPPPPRVAAPRVGAVAEEADVTQYGATTAVQWEG